MILIQDASQPPNIDKPLRIIGDPYKVQVPFWVEWFHLCGKYVKLLLVKIFHCVAFLAS